jgi:acyl carrier protein
MEKLVAGIWREVLGVEEVGLHDSFFDLGGHSLSMVQAQRRLSEELGRDIPMVDLFRAPTVAALAQLLGGTADVAEAAREGDERAEARRAVLGRRARRESSDA